MALNTINQTKPGADPGFQVRGAHFRKLRRAEGGAKIFGVFRVKNHDCTPKNHIFSNCGGRREIIWGISCEKSRFYNFRGGGGGSRVRPLPPGSAPANQKIIFLNCFLDLRISCNFVMTHRYRDGCFNNCLPSGAPQFTPVFSGIRVTRSLVLYVCFVDRCLSFCTFSFGHCVVCSSSIYGFCLSLWYLQTLLIMPFTFLNFEIRKADLPNNNPKIT